MHKYQLLIPLLTAELLCHHNLNTVDDFVGMGHFQEECQKDSLAAVSSFTQAIRLNPKAEEPYYHRANAYYALGNYKAAENLLQQYLSGNFGTGMMDARYQEMLYKVRNELSQLNS